MSYSFNFVASNKEEAKRRVAVELDHVVQAQPLHRNDRKQAQATAEAFIDICPEPGEGENLSVHMNGSLGWRGDGNQQDLTSAAVSVSATLARAVPKVPVGSSYIPRGS